MYSRWQLAAKYINYYLTASNGRGHGIHSPFIFEFVTKILRNERKYDDYIKVEALREQLLHDSRLLIVEDFGAGSEFLKKHERSIQSIARNSAKSKKYGQLLYRMAGYYSPKTILELGTSLGITTSYLSLANPGAKIITIEGACEIADIAKQNFSNLQLTNIEPVIGNFDNKLTTVLDNFGEIDFAFIDGNHRQMPTERYFEQILVKTNNNSVLIFDDIHWSPEMEGAWSNIKSHPSVRCSIDLFFLGLVFFRQEFREKQHFCIRF
ncbi:MAG: class I SAM-dependent methyltransferase [Sphingobacteriales bacterium]|nr:class I SAM-dependent methyltransferase [Sphingobacteriales bacterium]